MSVKHFVTVAAFAAVTGLAATSALASITIPTVPVGNPGKAADSSGFGSVAYTYNIGSTEVTNVQYAAFLNAVAATDTYSLYNGDGVSTGMAGSFGGITRSPGAGPYTYATVPGRESNPVNFVSFWDATRFANWLHNGQGSGDTETGAYTLTPGGISVNTITRNAGWQWAVTSEDEWYKAAYHQPAAAGGDSDNYWLYPTSSNNVPTTAQANVNYAINDTTPVGSYAANYYGIFDMGGNVIEWNEAIIYGSGRGLRGGAFNYGDATLQAGFRSYYNTSSNNYGTFGFRLSQVPGPSSIALLALGGLGALRHRRAAAV